MLQENDFISILKVHELAKAFIANIHKSAHLQVTLKPIYRVKAGRTYEYVKAQYYTDILDKESAIDYILDPHSKFSAWCDAAHILNNKPIDYAEIIKNIKLLKRTEKEEIAQAADYFITDYYTKLFKKAELKSWLDENKRLSAAVTFLYGRYDIHEITTAYMNFFENDPRCDLRTDMPYLLRYTTLPEVVIQKATTESWLLLNAFKKDVGGLLFCTED